MNMVASLKSFPGVARALLAHWKEEISETLVALFAFKVDIMTLHGRMPGSDENITVFYVGRQLSLSHFKKKFFVEAETLHSQKSNLLFFRGAMKTAKAKAQADIEIIDIGWPYNEFINKDGSYLELPDYICMVVTLEETWDATVQNFRKTMRKNIGRLIRKNDYRCVATNARAEAKRFYDTFYLAFIKSRHADETHLTPRAVIEQRAQDGTILQVVDDNGPVAAGIYFSHDDTLRLLATGMPEAFLDAPPAAAMQALYFYSLQYAFENGFKRIDFLGTRALPTNGLFQFKRKWGAQAEDEFSIDSILFRPTNTIAAAKFCELNPLVARKADETLQLLVCSNNAVFGDAECRKMLSDYHCGGIADVKVVHLSDQQTAASQTLTIEQTDVRVKTCDLADFTETYLHDD